MDDMHVIESLPAYALGSLDPDEVQQVDEHLLGCYLCRQELRSFQQVADHLAVAIPEVPPPDGLRLRLMERIRKPDAGRSHESPRRIFQPRLSFLGATVGVLVIVLLAVSNLLLWQRLQSMETLRGPLGMRAIVMHNTSAASNASGFVLVSADGENGAMVVDRLPPLPESQEYQVWLVHDDERTSAGLFSVDESGYRGLRLVAPKSLLTYSSVFVTVEPSGGSKQPTGMQVLNGSLFNP